MVIIVSLGRNLVFQLDFAGEAFLVTLVFTVRLDDRLHGERLESDISVFVVYFVTIKDAISDAVSFRHVSSMVG